MHDSVGGKLIDVEIFILQLKVQGNFLYLGQGLDIWITLDILDLKPGKFHSFLLERNIQFSGLSRFSHQTNFLLLSFWAN